MSAGPGADASPERDPPPAAAAEGTRTRVLAFTPGSLVRAVALLGATLLVVAMFTAARRPLGWLLAATVAAALLQPLVGRLSRHLPRALAVAIVFVGTLVLIGLVAYVAIDDLRVQAERIEREAPKAAKELEDSGGAVGEFATEVELEQKVKDFVDQLPERLRGGSTEDAIRAQATRGVAFLAAGILMLFMLASGPGFVRSGLRQIRDEDRRARTAEVLENAYRRAWRYGSLTIVRAALLGVLTALLAHLTDVPGPVLVAAWAAFWAMLPRIGIVIGALPITLLSVPSSVTQAGLIFAAYVAYQIVDVAFLERPIERRSLQVGPALLLIVGLLGLELYGIGGLLVSAALVIFVLAVAAELAPTDDHSVLDGARRVLDGDGAAER